MSDRHETIADIIAEMRKTYVSKGGAGYCGEVWIDLLRYADRLEAAHRRELSKNASKNEANFGQLSDCAKLREALCEILSYIESFHKYIIPGKREKTTAIFAVADTIRTKARAALDAPPRNCDLARDWMRDLYAHFQPPAGIKREMPPEWVDSVMAFCRWLVAPATEQEGGAK